MKCACCEFYCHHITREEEKTWSAPTDHFYFLSHFLFHFHFHFLFHFLFHFGFYPMERLLRNALKGLTSVRPRALCTSWMTPSRACSRISKSVFLSIEFQLTSAYVSQGVTTRSNMATVGGTMTKVRTYFDCGLVRVSQMTSNSADSTAGCPRNPNMLSIAELEVVTLISK